MDSVTCTDIEAAASRIKNHVHRTPVLSSSSIDRLLGCEIRFKCENFQKVGAFKARGACNAVLSLSDEQAESGVATHSSGNHGAAVAYAAGIRGIPSHVVMPENAPLVKRNAVEGYGATVVECESTLQARQSTLQTIVQEKGVHFIPPYDDERVIAGQGTAALEFYDQLGDRDIDILICPVGGGGLVSGCAIASKHLRPQTAVIAAEPLGANDAAIGFHRGERVVENVPETIADGLRTLVGVRNFAIIRSYVDDIVTVREETIVKAMRLVWERMKIIIEPSSAVPLAAVMEGNYEGKRIGIILSGGNVDMERLPWLSDNR